MFVLFAYELMHRFFLCENRNEIAFVCALHFNNRQSLRILSPDFDGVFNEYITDLGLLL